MEDDPKNFSVPAPGGFFFAGWIVAIIVVLIATAGLVLARELWIGRQTSALESENEAGPHVLVSQVSQAPATRDLKLPATIRGFDETDIYAKVPGYLKTLKVDKGDRIHKGQLLAILTSPELDQQVANARANYNLALITDQRNQALVHAQVIPQQTADESHGAMLQAKATLAQDVANQQYETITAPFDGIVTARYIDPGHLVPANIAPGTPGSWRDHLDLALQAAARVHLRAAEHRAIHQERRRGDYHRRRLPGPEIYRHHHAPS